jgi:hypothetical protein
MAAKLSPATAPKSAGRILSPLPGGSDTKGMTGAGSDVNRRVDGLGHACEAMPCALHAACVADEKRDTRRVWFAPLKADEISARTACTAPAEEERGSDVRETSTDTSTVRGTRDDWARRAEEEEEEEEEEETTPSRSGNN